MQNLLNHNGEQATIEIKTGHPIDHEFHTINKTWGQLTDSNKQDIASTWINDHVHTNVNQVMELLGQNEEHCEYHDYIDLAESKDYQYAVESDLNDKSIDELIEIIEEYDLENDVDHIELFKSKYLNDLIENTNNTSISKDDLFYELDRTFLTNPEEEDLTDNSLVTYFKDYYQQFCFDDLDTCITNLNINFDGYLKAYQADLVSLIEKNINVDQYGQDKDLEPEYDQAYEFYAVSDHFAAMLSGDCTTDLLGLTVWARFCTGQSIALDCEIQRVAFKALSDCSYTYY